MRELSLKEIQAGSLEALKKLKEICERENLRFYLFYGTLIGAVREHGFIEWDDDTDVWMPRDDYERLVEYCNNNSETLKPFELLHYKTNKDYIYPLARFSDSRYTVEYPNAKEYGLGLFVDIYPVDGFNPNDKAHLKRIQRNGTLIGIKGSNGFIATNNIFKTITKFFVYIFLKFKKMRKLLEKQDKLAKKYDYNASEMVDCVVWDKPKMLFRKDFEGATEVMFEGVPMPVPVGYDNILTSIYGDYMTPPPAKERGGNHFYKAFEKEKKE